MFTITSDVPFDMPMLASTEQQRFAAENQDVLTQGPLQPTHVPVGLHPPPLRQPQVPPLQQQEMLQQPHEGILQQPHQGMLHHHQGGQHHHQGENCANFLKIG